MHVKAVKAHREIVLFTWKSFAWNGLSEVNNLSLKQLSLFLPPFPIHPELIFLGHGREEKNNDKIYLFFNFDKIFFLSFRFCMIVVSIFWPLSYYTVLRLIFYPMNLIQLFFKFIFFFSFVFPTMKVPIFATHSLLSFRPFSWLRFHFFCLFTL